MTHPQRPRSGVLRLTVVAAAFGASTVLADPPPIQEIPEVFCFRITDIERVGGDDDAFNFEFEVLNWTDTPAGGLYLAATVGQSPVAGNLPTVTGASIDVDGRGGPTGGSDIGSGVFDDPSHQSGRGRGDVTGLLNDWTMSSFSSSAITFDVGVGTALPNRDLIGAFQSGRDGPEIACSLIPGATFNLQSGVCDTSALDSTGDTAIDGGPGVVVNPVTPDGSGNVLDGFVLTVDDFDVGEVFSVNWFLLDGGGQPIGQVAGGNAYGFGTLSLARTDPGAGSPGTVFVGNSGLAQSQIDFFDSVWNIPNPSWFWGELGGGLTAPFRDPNDNIFDVQTNTSLIPTPAPLALLLTGSLLLLARTRRA